MLPCFATPRRDAIITIRYFADADADAVVMPMPRAIVKRHGATYAMLLTLLMFAITP